MSEVEKVVLETRKLESLLRVHYHAEGEGLHQLINSSEERLPHLVIAKLHRIATERNKVVGEEHYQLDDKAFFSLVSWR